MTHLDDAGRCVVIGAGLSGLATGVRLATSGVPVTVVDGASSVGGRARTSDVHGMPADRGFQSIFTAYPQTARFLRDIGLREHDMIPFARGAVVHDGIDWQQLSVGARSVRRFRALSTGDVVRLARLAADVGRHSSAALLRSDVQDETMVDYLRRRGFSDVAIEGFFRPLFGVITLDMDLGADAGYFLFLMRMLVIGRAAIPVEGHGMIAEWARATIIQSGGVVRLDAPAAQVRVGPAGAADGVVLADGEFVPASQVVVAVDAAAAEQLLAPVDPEVSRLLRLQPAGVTTLVYSLARSFHRGRTIVLNGAPGAGDARVDLVCQESNLTRPDTEGMHVLLATSVHRNGVAPDSSWLEGEMARVAGRWNPGYDWGRHARVAEVVVQLNAQFGVGPGVRRGLPGPRTRVANLVLAGDCTQHPSIEGAVASGNAAADIVSALRV